MHEQIDWQIYGSMVGAGKVNRALTSKFHSLIKKAEKTIAKEGRSIATHMGVKVRDEMYKTMDKYQKYGTRDTEPECVLCYEIERALGLDNNSLDRS